MTDEGLQRILPIVLDLKAQVKDIAATVKAIASELRETREMLDAAASRRAGRVGV